MITTRASATVTPLLPRRGYLLIMRRRHPLTATSAVAAAALLLVAAGCGGRSATGLTTGSTMSHQATGLVAYASCMRSQGLPSFPDPVGSGGIPKEAVVSAFRQVSASKAEAAQNDCRHLLPAGGSLSGQVSQPITAQDQQDYLKAASCMRLHGFSDFPDPKFHNDSVQVNIPPSINQNSSRFTSAATTCTKLIPAGLPGTHRG